MPCSVLLRGFRGKERLKCKVPGTGHGLSLLCFSWVFFQDPAWTMKLNWSVRPSGSHAVINSACNFSNKNRFWLLLFWSTFDLFVFKRNFYENTKQPSKLQMPMDWVHFQQTPHAPSPCQQASDCICSGCEFLDPNLKSDP